jgi:hypothetical protein
MLRLAIGLVSSAIISTAVLFLALALRVFKLETDSAGVPEGFGWSIFLIWPILAIALFLVFLHLTRGFQPSTTATISAKSSIFKIFQVSVSIIVSFVAVFTIPDRIPLPKNLFITAAIFPLTLCFFFYLTYKLLYLIHSKL